MILLVDNNDSYTYNLYQLIAKVCGQEPLVVSTDAVVKEKIPHRVAAGEFTHVVISPGPGSPHNHSDFAGSRSVIEAADKIPLLGVCLGHQGIAAQWGQTVTAAPQPIHGGIAKISHSGKGIFSGLPQEFQAVRYHSLAVSVDPNESFYNHLEVHARSEDGVIMALKVIGRPHWGVQFHPESVLTEEGYLLLKNFLSIKDESSVPKMKAKERKTEETTVIVPAIPKALLSSEESEKKLENAAIRVQRLQIQLDLFALLSKLNETFSTVVRIDCPSENNRYSVVGVHAGPNSRLWRYNYLSETERLQGMATTQQKNGKDSSWQPLNTDILEVLSDYISEMRVIPTELPDTLPFRGGLLGYFGYEMKALTCASGNGNPSLPDAYWLSPQYFLVYDHQRHIVYLSQLTDMENENHPFEKYLSQEDPSHKPVQLDDVTTGKWGMPDESYLNKIQQIKRYLHEGQTYEICLTDTYSFSDPSLEGLEYFQSLYSKNPADYAAYLRMSEDTDDIEVVCTSPELFLEVNEKGKIRTKPIKGTTSRQIDPVRDEEAAIRLRTDPKTRAENLMIVDLLRNDFGKVSELGSVEVAELMQVESGPVVHSLVSTIEANKLPELSAIDVFRHCFPGGSMTGAPKIRVLHLLEKLEAKPRGIYSGCIGFLGFNGTAQLNIVIRSAVRCGDQWSVGAGGAIILDSVPEDELAERNLKAASLLFPNSW